MEAGEPHTGHAGKLSVTGDDDKKDDMRCGLTEAGKK